MKTKHTENRGDNILRFYAFELYHCKNCNDFYYFGYQFTFYCPMCRSKLIRLDHNENKKLETAIDLLIEKWHEIEGHPEPSDRQAGYQAACAVIMEAICQKEEKEE